jgi:hypothetical protein
MEVNDILNEVSVDLTREIRRIIKEEGLISTGLLYNSILVECAYVPMINKRKFVISYDAPYYFQYLDGNYELTKKLTNSSVYGDAITKFQDFLEGKYDLNNTTREGLKDLLGDMVIAKVIASII